MMILLETGNFLLLPHFFTIIENISILRLIFSQKDEYNEVLEDYAQLQKVTGEYLISSTACPDINKKILINNEASYCNSEDHQILFNFILHFF